MVSYLDMITILLVFFVAAAAKSFAPKTQATVPPAPPVATAAPKPPAEPDDILQKLEKAGVEVRREPRGLVVSLPQPILFPPGDDRITSGAVPIIGRVAEVLQTVPNRVIVVGHADSIPIHNNRFRSNWDLSVARGMRMLELLSRNYQIAEDRLSVSGDGSNHPAGTNETPEGRAVNRRVELVILDEPAAAH